jgi:hypothetical protein
MRLSIPNLVLVLAVVLASGCLTGKQTPKERLPVGVFTNEASQGYIRIEENQLTLHLLSSNGYFDKRCEYDLWPDGTIIMVIPGRFAEYHYGVGRFGFFWDGKNILVHERHVAGTNDFHMVHTEKPQ